MPILRIFRLFSTSWWSEWKRSHTCLSHTLIVGLASDIWMNAGQTVKPEVLLGDAAEITALLNELVERVEKVSH